MTKMFTGIAAALVIGVAGFCVCPQAVAWPSGLGPVSPVQPSPLMKYTYWCVYTMPGPIYETHSGYEVTYGPMADPVTAYKHCILVSKEPVTVPVVS